MFSSLNRIHAIHAAYSESHVEGWIWSCLWDRCLNTFLFLCGWSPTFIIRKQVLPFSSISSSSGRGCGSSTCVLVPGWGSLGTPPCIMNEGDCHPLNDQNIKHALSREMKESRITIAGVYTSWSSACSASHYTKWCCMINDVSWSLHFPFSQVDSKFRQVFSKVNVLFTVTLTPIY